MIKNVRHIIFDLGGVILNIDYNKAIESFQQLGIDNFNDIYSQAAQSELFDKLEKGLIGEDEFVAGIQALSRKPLTQKQIVDSWNSLVLDFPLRRLQILQQLRLHHDLFLLSNTNEIHELAFNTLLEKSHGIPNLGVFFDKVYLSHRVGMRKPDKEIFQRVLDENGLKAEHTLFIDDSIQHIEAAKSLGIQTIFLEKGMTIEDNVFLPKQ